MTDPGDLTFYPLRNSITGWITFPIQPEAWIWLPPWPSFPNTLETMSDLAGAGWIQAGSWSSQSFAVWALSSQLSHICRLEAKDEQGQMDDYIWTPAADKVRVEKLPVLLAFTVSPEQHKQAKVGDSLKYLTVQRSLPPSNLGKIGLVLTSEGDKQEFKRCPITKLPKESQVLQQLMGAALDRLASAHKQERSAWLAQWKDIQEMDRTLAADYWRAYQDSQVERPKPINIWTLRQGESTLAAMTMVQDGAHASINNIGKWEREHMIHEGQQQGVMLPRYIHRHSAGETEYWMQHPEEAEVPVDLDLVSQEVLGQQAKLDELEQDLVMLTPTYLLAKGEEEVAISPEQLLRDLDLEPKHNQAGYGNGYRPEEIQRVIDAFERLRWLRIKTRQTISKSRGRKPALITAEAPYLIITEWLWQEPLLDGQSRKLLGWKYQITWLKQFTGDTEAGKQLGVLLKKSFGFKQNQRWEKRLARYLTIHLCVAAHKGQASIPCKIRNVLEHCGLMPTEHDKAHPGAYAKQFEDAMDHLKRENIIGDWIPKIDRHAPSFPARAWLDLWLDSSFRVTQAPTALAAGYQKMIDARKLHKELDEV